MSSITKYIWCYKVWQKFISKFVRYYKVCQVLQSVTDCYYKVCQVLQSVTDCYYKVRQVLQSVTDCYYKVHQVLQSETGCYYKVRRYYKVWRNIVFRPLFEKRIQQNSVNKKSCFEKKIESEINFEHFVELAMLATNARWRMQHFSDTK